LKTKKKKNYLNNFLQMELYRTFSNFAKCAIAPFC